MFLFVHRTYMSMGRGRGGDSPQAPITYFASYELFETLTYYDPPPLACRRPCSLKSHSSNTKGKLPHSKNPDLKKLLHVTNQLRAN